MSGPRRFKVPQSVLVVIFTPALEVLLIRRADADDYWQSVTGSKDTEEEAFHDTAVREVFEETGIDCTGSGSLAGRLQDWGIENIYSIYPQWLHRYAPGVTHNTERVFGLEVPPGTSVRLDPREHTAYRWLPWREAADVCASGSNAEAVLMLPRFLR